MHKVFFLLKIETGVYIIYKYGMINIEYFRSNEKKRRERV